MSRTDLILLHAPSVYDFREKPILYGPVSDMVPSTQIFEMYPMGFVSILEYLHRHGYSARIINVALKMLRSRRFDAEKLIKGLKPMAFGVDLHWLVHAQGSLELAKIVKKHHPDIPVIFGGISASYYHEELITYPQVDYVVRGDSTEEPLRQLLSAIKEGRTPDEVPNLTWKDGSQVRMAEMTHVPANLDDISFDYSNIMKSTLRHFDILGHIPFKKWFSYPVLAALSCRGCVNDCAICGGSASAWRKISSRSRPAYWSPDVIAREIGTMSRHMNAPVIILADIRQGGDENTRKLLIALKKEHIKSPVAFEFYSPPSREFLEMLSNAVGNFNIQISPETHDEDIRKAFGKAYTNEALETSITDAIQLGCKRLDIFFMIGIPEQTPSSVRDTVQYCRELMEKYGSNGHSDRVHPYISPLAPFLDPGSRAFEEPEKHGYRLFHRTLEEHRKSLLFPSWKQTLNYETKWMSRDELVDVTYEAALELNEIKLEHGQMSTKEAARITARIAHEKDLIAEIDTIYAERDGSVDGEDAERMRELMHRFDNVGSSTICWKEAMNWPTGLFRLNPLGIIRGMLTAKSNG